MFKGNDAGLFGSQRRESGGDGPVGHQREFIERQDLVDLQPLDYPLGLGGAKPGDPPMPQMALEIDEMHQVLNGENARFT